MNFDDIDLQAFVTQLDERRQTLNLSYQNVADCCNVSQKTIMRLFKHESDPSFTLLQKVVSALQYDFVQSPTAPANATMEEYAQYLRDCIAFERKDKKIRLDQQEARFNRLRNENRRVIVVLGGIVGILVIFICGVLVYDFTHPDRGWIQYIQSGYITARNWLRNLL